MSIKKNLPPPSKSCLMPGLISLGTSPGMASSLHRKINLGYHLIGLLVVAIAAFVFVELRNLEEMVISGEATGEFFNSIMEVRRFEKNYFLYGEEADLKEHQQYLGRSQNLILQKAGDFALILNSGTVKKLAADLDSYAELWREYPAFRQDLPRKILLEGEIRTLGREIVTIGENLVRKERETIHSRLLGQRENLIIGIVFVTLSVMAAGQALANMVLKPLDKIERNMRAISQGTLKKIDISSQDKEIISLTQAFNRMLFELEERQAHLVRSQKLASLGTMLSGVAHELNNPLANISSSAQIMAEEWDENNPDFKRTLLAQIEGECERARVIVASLLDFTREREIRKSSFNFKEMLETTLSFVRGKMGANISIETSVPPDLSITADRQRLQQVILNLIENAIDALPEGGMINITATAQEIRVKDNGVGMDAITREKVFDPFFTTKEVGHGMGLGLFIVHEIIAEHGWQITVESQINQGTTFVIKVRE